MNVCVVVVVCLLNAPFLPQGRASAGISVVQAVPPPKGVPPYLVKWCKSSSQENWNMKSTEKGGLKQGLDDLMVGLDRVPE